MVTTQAILSCAALPDPTADQSPKISPEHDQLGEAKREGVLVPTLVRLARGGASVTLVDPHVRHALGVLPADGPSPSDQQQWEETRRADEQRWLAPQAGASLGASAADHDAGVDSLELSVRTYRALMKLGVTTVDALVRCSERELLDAEGLGRGAVKAIKEALVERGLSLRVASR